MAHKKVIFMLYISCFEVGRAGLFAWLDRGSHRHVDGDECLSKGIADSYVVVEAGKLRQPYWLCS